MTTSDVSAYGVFPSFNNKTPKEGPRYIPMTFDFSSTDTWDVDMMQLQQAGKISTLQAFYVDNSLNTVELIITMGLGGQVIKVQPGYQGFMTALVNNVPKFSVSSAGGVSAIVFALNFPVVNALWPAAPNATAGEAVTVTNFPAVYPISATSDIPVAVSNFPATQDVNVVGPTGQMTMAQSIPVVIANDQTGVNVSLSGNSLANLSFKVQATAILAVTTVSAAVAISASLVQVIRVYNYGAETAFVRVSTGSAVVGDTAIAPNDSLFFVGLPSTQVAAICATTGTSLQISVGLGAPQ